jgi:hypothetical protein
MQFPQNLHGLLGEGNNVRGFGLRHSVAPFRRVQVKVRPFGLAPLLGVHRMTRILGLQSPLSMDSPCAKDSNLGAERRGFAMTA